MEKNYKEILSELVSGIKGGKTLYIQSATKIMKVRKSDLEKWDKYGKPLMIASDSDIKIRGGSGYVSIKYCSFLLE